VMSCSENAVTIALIDLLVLARACSSWPRFLVTGSDVPCHSEVAGQGTVCRLWSGCSRRYASGKLRTSVKVSGTEEP